VIIVAAGDARMSSHVGAKSGGLLHIEAPGDVTDRYYGVFGPYLNLGKGRYRAELKLSVSEPYPTGVVFDICCEAGRVQPYSQACAPADFEAGVVAVSSHFPGASRTLKYG